MEHVQLPVWLASIISVLPEAEQAVIIGLWSRGVLVTAPHAAVIPGPGITHVLIVEDGKRPRLVQKRF